MTEPISHMSEPKSSLRRYRIRRSLGIVSGLLAGVILAYAEHRSWLPNIFSQIFVVNTITPTLVGPCIAQTMLFPLLFGIGLHHTAYYHISGKLCFFFWLLHGADLLPCFLYAPLSLILLLPVLLWMATLVLHADAIAAAGICSSTMPVGLRPLAYLGNTLRTWGAGLIAQFIFYVLLIKSF